MLLLLLLTGCDAFFLVPFEGWQGVSTGSSHICALDPDGAAHCTADELGGTTPPAGPFTDLASGQGFSCGRAAAGARCWGDPQESWIAVLDPPDVALTQLDAGQHHVCGIAEGEVLCWGHADKAAIPAEILALDVVAVSAGGTHSCVLDAAGALHCWGEDGPWLAEEAGPAGPYQAIAAGYQVSCAAPVAGGLVCFGADPATDTGADTGATVAVPETRAFDGLDLIALDLGYGPTEDGQSTASLCGLSRSGRLVCTASTLPDPVDARDPASAVDLSPGADFGCAVLDGALSCLGDGTPALPTFSR